MAPLLISQSLGGHGDRGCLTLHESIQPRFPRALLWAWHQVGVLRVLLRVSQGQLLSSVSSTGFPDGSSRAAGHPVRSGGRMHDSRSRGREFQLHIEIT